MDIENEGPRVPDMHVERGGNITEEQLTDLIKGSETVLMVKVVDSKWCVIVDEQFAAAMRSFEPLHQMHISSTVIALLRKALQAITDAA